MRRGAAVASVLFAVVLGAALPAGATAASLLETLTVPGLSPPPGVTTKTVLKKGANYRLEVSGTITSTFTPPGGVTIGEREDAFYCFEELNEAAVSPSFSCTKNIRYLGVMRALIGGQTDFVETALGIQGRIPYQPSHAYKLDFRAPRSGALTFHSTKNAGLSPQGSFELKLYGSSAKKKKKKRKKRISGCPAVSASSPRAHAARSCHWEVSYVIEQDGSPSNSFPDPAVGFVKSETTGLGKIFFNAKPKLGRTSVGRAAGLLAHTDTYQSALSPFLFPQGKVKLKPLVARYTPGNGQVKLDFNAVVTSVAGQLYSQDPSGQGTEAGDGVRVRATYDFPHHQNDFLQLYFGCSACIKGSAGLKGLHVHDFVTAPDNKQRITVGAPKQLSGGCNCLGTTP